MSTIEDDDSKPMLHAPYYSLPLRHQRFVALEYPGPIKSITKAIDSLGGLTQISAALNSPLKGDDIKKPRIELQLMRGPNGHPVPGFIGESGNLVMRVVKRRRKRSRTTEEQEEGVYRYDILGVAHRTVRFRGEFIAIIICLFVFGWGVFSGAEDDVEVG